MQHYPADHIEVFGDVENETGMEQVWDTGVGGHLLYVTCYTLD